MAREIGTLGTDVIVCPTCQEHIDPFDRCPVGKASLRCMERAGHHGFHWTDTGHNGVLVWFGPFSEHRCPGRLSLDRWCTRKPGHDGTHNDGRGVSFGDPEPIEEAS